MTNYERGVGYKAGKIICKSNSLTSNVVIPNGDIQLCCMDYGLESKLGNLLEDDYDSLHNGSAMKYITDRMTDDTIEGDIICRRSENAGYEVEEEFKKMVNTAKKYIFEGEIFQVVLSRIYKKKINVEALSVYRALRNLNPSPYLFFMNFYDL